MAYKSAIESACGLALLALLLAASAAGDDSSSSAWDYGDLHGPPEWPGLCHDGKLQSPVNLQVPSPLPTQGVMAQLNWSSTARVRVETSAIGARKVEIPPGSTTTINGKQYVFAHYHFHTPSEHALNGQRGFVELHLVHNDTATGGNAVLGILFNRSGNAPQESLSAYLNNLPSGEPGKATVSNYFNLDLNAAIGSLLPANLTQGRIMTYNGSLTTPPCTESITWLVSSLVPSMPDSQILDFSHSIKPANALSLNSRPLQELHDRSVQTM